jgi:hypothetical protein
MSEAMPSIGSLRADFAERNTALFLLLGLLSSTTRLTKALSDEKARSAAEPQQRDEPTRFHYFLLGVVAFSGKVSGLAQRGRDTAEPLLAPVPPDVPRDLLR